MLRHKTFTYRSRFFSVDPISFLQLERFLIANRDDYLKHSSEKNYTAEQKQYNNWLTERLLEVADRNHYIFDPNDFNFVAVRDRIRCYYKSFVQTARKRGSFAPSKLGTSQPKSKKAAASAAAEGKGKTVTAASRPDMSSASAAVSKINDADAAKAPGHAG